MFPDGGISPGSEEWETARNFAKRYKIAFVDLPSISIPPDEIIATIPAAVATEHRFVPLAPRRRQGGDPEAVDQLFPINGK